MSVLLIFELLLLGAFAYLLNRSEIEAARAERSKSIVIESQILTKCFYDSAMALGFYGFTRSHPFQTRYQTMVAAVPEHIAKLQELASSDSQDRQDMTKVTAATAVSTKIFTDVEKMVENCGDSVPDAVELGKNIKKRLYTPDFYLLIETISDLAEKHKRYTEIGLRRYQRLKSGMNVLILVGLISNIALAIVLVVVFSKRITTRLDILNGNAFLIAQSKPLNKPIGGDDEIAHLDRAIHQMAADLEQAAENQRAIEQVKREFVSIVSHDLRTPLTSLRAILSALPEEIDGHFTQSGATLINTAQQESIRLISLTNDLLDIARMESGKFELDLQDTELSDVLSRSVLSVKPLAEKKKISIEVGATDLLLSADFDRLMQVVVNLLSNAIKFSEANSVVRISTSQKGNFAEISVSDQGCGIPEQFRAKIFDRFEQVKSRESNEHRSGSGLGLAICKLIVDAHGGIIDVESQSGKGSRFFFLIPLAQTGVRAYSLS